MDNILNSPTYWYEIGIKSPAQKSTEYYRSLGLEVELGDRLDANDMAKLMITIHKIPKNEAIKWLELVLSGDFTHRDIDKKFYTDIKDIINKNY